MPLQSYEIPFVAGQDEGTNVKVVVTPRLRRAVNLRSVRTGELSKIRGMAAIGTATVDPIGVSAGISPVGPVQLFTHGQQLVACSETSLFTLSEATVPSKWEEVEDGIATKLQGKLSLGHYGAKDIASCGVAATSTFTVYAWFTTRYSAAAVSAYELHVMTVDNATGAGSAGTKVTINGTTSSDINPSVKLIALGSKVTVFWAEIVSGLSRIRYLDITSATSGPYPASDAGTTLITGGVWATAQFYDIANHGSGYVVAYWNGSGVVAARYNSSHALQATASALSVTGTLPRVGVCGNLVDGLSTIHVGIVTDNGSAASRVVVYGLSDAIATQSTYTDTSEPYALSIAMGEFDGTRSQMVYGTQSEGVRLKYFAGGSLVNQSGKIPNAYVCGKPIGRSAKSYFAIQYYTSRPNSCAAIVRVDPGFDGAARADATARPEVSINRGQAVAALSTGSVTGNDAAHCVSYVGDELKLCFPVVDRFSGPITAADPTGDAGAGTTNVVERIGVDGWSFKFGARDRYRSVQVGGYTFLGGGSVLQFDGKRIVELGFWSYPDVPDASLVASTSGGNMADGTYTYAFCWEWVDYLGNRHQSAVKFATATITGGGGAGKVTITAPPGMPLTFKRWRIQGDDSRPVVLAIYRSRSDIEDVDGGQASVHRLEGSGVAAFLENDPNAVTSIGTYVDTYNSTTIALVTRELIYTSSLGASELDNVPPPPATELVAHDGRLFGIDARNPRQLWYTKQGFEGSALAWNETLIVPLEEEATALASQDGNLIVFSARSVYTVIGRPADNTGASTGYEPPQRLSTEVGCPAEYARTVCATPAGTFFRNARGIQLLPRGGGNAEFVGKAIQDTLALYPIVTSVTHVSAENSVLFALVDSETLSDVPAGVVLAFDYAIGQWFTREYRGAPIASMTVHQGNLAVGVYSSGSSATVWREDSGWDDATGAFVGWTIETGDIRTGGFSGSQTVNFATLLGERRGSCQVQIREQVDLATSWSSAVAWDLTTAEAELLRRYQTKSRKSTRLRLEIQETQSGVVVDTEGLAVTGMLLEAAPLRGGARLASARQG